MWNQKLRPSKRANQSFVIKSEVTVTFEHRARPAVRAYDDLLFDYLISVSVKRVGNAPGPVLHLKSKHPPKTAFFVCFAGNMFI